MEQFVQAVNARALPLLLGLMLYSMPLLYSQDCPTGKENNVWYFGEDVGLDFNTSPPTILSIPPSVSCWESTSTWCTPEGKLLFYAMPNFIRDSQFKKVRGATTSLNGNLAGSPSATQDVLIPKPGKDSMLYYFYSTSVDIPDDEIPPVNYYSVIDLKKNRPFGALVAQDVVLESNVTEKVFAARHCNGIDWWVLYRSGANNQHYARLLTESGLQPPVISRVGHPDSLSEALKTGGFKVSPDGEWLINVPGGHSGVVGAELSRFDRSSGKITLHVDLTKGKNVSGYGVAFSPDATKLYLHLTHLGNFITQRIHQFDLSDPHPDSILASEVVVAFMVLNGGALALAPDGKIYYPSYFTPYLNAILYPNKKGLACTHVPRYLQMPKESNLGLPSPPADVFDPGRPFIRGRSRVCYDQGAVPFRVNLNCEDGLQYRWLLNGQEIPGYDSCYVNFPGPGTYQLVVQKTWACGTKSDTMWVEARRCQPCQVDFEALTPATPVCSGSSVSINISSNATQLWHLQQGDSLPVNNGIWQSGALYQDSCVVFLSGNGSCSRLDTVCIAVSPSLPPTESTAFICPGSELSWHGQLIRQPGRYTHTLSSQMGCDSTLILEVGFYTLGSPAVTTDSPSCHGAEDGSLKVLEPGSTFYWNGTTHADSLVLSSIGGGSYWITLLTADQCADTLLVWLSQPAPLEARILGLQNPYPYTGTAVTLNVNVTGGTPPYQYSWSSTPGLSCYDCPAPLAQPVEDALFRIQVVDAYGCDSQDSIQFRYLAEDYFIPSAFSPNGDGRNDIFLLYSKDANLTYELSIYDRWGAQVVQRINIPANDPNQGWNGNKNSQSLPAGVYPYLIRLSNGKILSGEVTLIR